MILYFGTLVVFKYYYLGVASKVSEIFDSVRLILSTYTDDKSSTEEISRMGN